MDRPTSIEDQAREIEQARCEILTWLLSQAPGQELSDAQLVNSAGEWGRTEYGLQLRAYWNPSASAFEAYWVHGESVADWFERPFSADTAEQAQLLACAGLLRVIDGMYSN
jgi:hypothetical protein